MRDQLLGGSKGKIVGAEARVLTGSHLVVDVSGVFFSVFRQLSGRMPALYDRNASTSSQVEQTWIHGR